MTISEHALTFQQIKNRMAERWTAELVFSFCFVFFAFVRAIKSLLAAEIVY